MDKLQAIAIAKPLFESHTTVSELHITSDGQAFFEDHTAANHAKETLKDKVVFKVTKGETLEAVKTEKTAEEKKGEAQQLILDINARQLKTRDLLAKAKTEETKAKHQGTLDALDAELKAAQEALAAFDSE